MSTATVQTPLPRTDFAFRIFGPHSGGTLDFVGVRQAITADLKAAAEIARRADDWNRAGALGRFAREQAARPAGPGTWGTIVADAEQARCLISGQSSEEASSRTGTGLVVTHGLVVDLYVCTRDPGIHVRAGDVMAFIEPVCVGRDVWADALDAARARAGGKTTPAPVVLFACGTVRRCEGATDLVPIEGEPGRFDVTRTKLIPVGE